MAQVQNIDELRKRRDQKKNRRRAGIVAVLVLIVALSVLGLQIFIRSGASVKLDTAIARFRGSPGYPVLAPAGEVLGMELYGSGPAILTDTGLFSYHSDARQSLAVQHGMSNPVARFSQSRILLYDRGGTILTVYGKGSEIFKKIYDYPIFTAALSKYGELAVVTGSQQHAGEITVYTSSFEEKFKWYSADDYITQVTLSPLGDLLAFGSMGTRGGVLVSTVRLFGFQSEEALMSAEYEDAGIYSVRFKGDGSLHVITSRFVAALDAKGKETGRYSFGNAPLSYFSDESASGTVLILGNPRKNGVGELVSLDLQCRKQGSLALSHAPASLKADNKYIYLLGTDSLHKYTLKCETVFEMNAPNALNFIPSSNEIYFVSGSEVWMDRKLP